MSGRAKSDFLEFLDWLGSKGLMPLATAQARKATANKVLAALEDDELSDITALDIDDVMHRFTNKFGKNYTLESARTYKSRFETSVADFKAYCENPVGFRPSGRSPNRIKLADGGDEKTTLNANGKRPAARKAPKKVNAPLSSEVPSSNIGNVVPVQIRPELTVRIGPIPYDLTSAEAKRIANVILALAVLDN